MRDTPSTSSAARVFAAGGGLAFVSSLAYFGYVYGVRLGDVSASGAAPVVEALWKNALLFSVFASHHSAAARDGVKRLIGRLVTPSLERSTYVWIASILFTFVCFLWVPAEGDPLYSGRGAFLAIGYGVQALGLALIASASGRIDPLALAGVRQPNRDVPATLREDGPYAWVRHPLYLGWLLVVFGAPRMTPSRLMLAAISSSYMLLAVPWEERALARLFGEPYREYARRVRWRVVPYLF